MDTLNERAKAPTGALHHGEASPTPAAPAALPVTALGRLTRTAMKAPIHVYRWTLKPLIGLECRHLPTCSEYALEAIELNGAWRGGWLALARICRCHPWGSHGYDPPPDIRSAYHPFAPWRYGRWHRTRQGDTDHPKEMASSQPSSGRHQP